MSKINYEDWQPRGDRLTALGHADRIAVDYASQGYNLTLRQLYYRFVATDILPDDRRYSWSGSKWVRDPKGLDPESTKNAGPNYDWLGGIVNRGRMAGYLDWKHFEDRTRNLLSWEHWDSPKSIIEETASEYREDLWAAQPVRIEVWVEKDALIDVVGRAASEFVTPHFSCRGYVSQSEMWRAGQRIIQRAKKGQGTVILHLGDHDPSGMDMTRDIRDRLELFTYLDIPVENVPIVSRIALNMDQIEEYNPPPNPTKLTDSRARSYIEEYGDESWELDALEPGMLDSLIKFHIQEWLDLDAWKNSLRRQEANRDQIRSLIELIREDE